MAINIFQGQASKSKVNSAAQSTRAKAAAAAAGGNAVASDSGNTAVKSSGTLSKIGNTVGKIAEVASKFLPGIGGTIAKGISNIFNDPEWWQSVPGEAVTCNVPLRSVVTDSNTIVSGDTTYRGAVALRGAILEFSLWGGTSGSSETTARVITPDDQMITQYLMPEIRKVVNAIPLQSADAYNQVLRVQCSIYALWRQLLKIDFMTKHGQTYLPNMNVALFPALQVANAAWLQSTINRLEEYLRANVRIPHTLCEYLAWRFGRVYRAHETAKSGLVLYNVVPLTTSIQSINAYISALMQEVASTPERQQANTDLYNAYYDHDLIVEIRDDTQFSYDKKEFMLRTNLDVGSYEYDDNNPSSVYIDSSLDNVTTFMASTVSTYGTINESQEVLFPVVGARFYNYSFEMYSGTTGDTRLGVIGWNEIEWGTLHPGSIVEFDGANYMVQPKTFLILTLMKSMDVYNKDLYFAAKQGPLGNGTPVLIDYTAPGFDLGQVSDVVLGNEHVFAFANLVHQGRKTSTTYSQAERAVAKETANLIDKLDVGAVASPTKK